MNTLREKRAEVFAENYRRYLAQLAQVDFPARAAMLDIEAETGQARVSFFGSPYRVAAEGITDTSGAQAPYDVCVVLARYILMCPKRLPANDAWSAYRDFKDAGPLTVFFADNVETAIAASFSGRLSALDRACRALGGGPPAAEGLSYDLAMQIYALPRIPMLVLFNDTDEEFPAQCSVLFEARAERYLDAESLVILGSQLSRRLKTDD